MLTVGAARGRAVSAAGFAVRKIRLPFLLLLAAIGLPARAADAADSLNWYEWIEAAPVVMTGKPVGDEGGYELVRIERILRGAPPAEPVVRIDVGRANRERDRLVHRHALRLETGVDYVLLLHPAPATKRGVPPTYELVRGVTGVRELPAEGAVQVVEAVEQFVEIQDRGEHERVWHRMADLLEATDPLLIETALEQFLKFRRGDTGLLPVVRPLLDHPTAELRERSAQLIGQLLARARRRADPFPEPQRLRDELVARARRDGSVEVRIAAAEALAQFEDETTGEILGEIADDDPDQRVRFAAEKLIYERRVGGAPPGRAR
jgi:hypothetical protein